MAAVDKNLPAEIRSFAAANGLSAGSRGRLPRDTVMAFLVAKPRKVSEIAGMQGVSLAPSGRTKAARQAREDSLRDLAKSIAG